MSYLKNHVLNTRQSYNVKRKNIWPLGRAIAGADTELKSCDAVLTFLCTSVRMRYSADRSRLAFRLGRTELNRSGENLKKHQQH